MPIEYPGAWVRVSLFDLCRVAVAMISITEDEGKRPTYRHMFPAAGFVVSDKSDLTDLAPHMGLDVRGRNIFEVNREMGSTPLPARLADVMDAWTDFLADQFERRSRLNNR